MPQNWRLSYTKFEISNLFPVNWEIRSMTYSYGHQNLFASFDRGYLDPSMPYVVIKQEMFSEIFFGQNSTFTDAFPVINDVEFDDLRLTTFKSNQSCQDLVGCFQRFEFQILDQDGLISSDKTLTMHPTDYLFEQ